MTIKWQEFLQFYTGLNSDRKDYDEKYEKETGIGEEIENTELIAPEENST